MSDQNDRSGVGEGGDRGKLSGSSEPARSQPHANDSRLGHLRELIVEQRLDAMLVSYPTEICYLTGFVGEDSLVLVDGEQAVIVSDPRYDEYLDPWRGVAGIDVVMGVRHRLPESIARIVGERGLNRVGLQAERMTVAGRHALVQEIAGAELVDTTGLLTGLRMRKDPGEVAAIERSIGIQQEAIGAALAELETGMTELELAARVEYEMKRRGAARASFDTIVATGANSSVIHHTTGIARIEEGVLLVDWGAMSGAYCSDMTRTFGVGRMPPKLSEIYGIVLEAQQTAIEHCAPGRTCAEIDAVARRIITAAGYGELFGHGLGHGLGMEVHESPYFNDLETTTRLTPGMVMTVEPGIYLPGVGGIRIEDDVLITDDGCRVLGNYPTALDSVIVEPRSARTVRSM